MERKNISNSLTALIQALYIFRLNFVITSGSVRSCTNSPTLALSCEFNSRCLSLSARLFTPSERHYQP